jgi:purine-binding chemotaxis protein CheW
MSESIQLVVFVLDEQRYALHLSAVERIVRAIEITSLPNAPEIVLGIINVQGQIIPVVNPRKRFRLSERELRLSDQLIIAHTSRRTVALVADAVGGVVERAEEDVMAADSIIPAMGYVEGVAKLEDGMVYIHDLDEFLSPVEERILNDALPKT